MKYRHFFMVCLLGVCANANAEWFLRGTHNAWAAAQMDSAGAGTNTVQLKGVVFSAAGGIKFDRFGDWKESYGQNGGNIPVAAGTWDIKFFTDTKKWAITAPQQATAYHLRGTFNAWAEGTLMTRIGTTDNYESCVQFIGGDANGGPRFKVDPNGAWGDTIPATDFNTGIGWAKITFNSLAKTIFVEQSPTLVCSTTTSSASAIQSSSSAANSSVVASSSVIVSSSVIAASSVPASSSVAVSSSIPASSSAVVSSSAATLSSSAASSVVASSVAATSYHLRGTFNAWAEGTLLSRVGTTDSYERCVNFTGGDASGGPRFKVDPNGAWGDAIPAADFSVAQGWVKVTFNSITKAISTLQNQPANCATASSSLAISSSSIADSSTATSSSAPAIVYHLRGTFNAWAEGTFLTRINPTTDSYEACANFTGGDASGGPRFKVDPNGAWGDAIPAADFGVSQGWVKIAFNSTSKTINVQQNLSANCGASSVASSSAASSSVASSSAISAVAVSSATASSSTGATLYHLRGTNNAWLEGTLMEKIGTTNTYEKCANFVAGDNNGSPRFKIDPNGAWGDAIPAADVVVAAGWVKISFNSTTKLITTQQNLTANCGAVVYHLRGTHNAWAEGDLFTSVDGIQPLWSICRNFGPAETAPRFKVDPNGAWGADTFPSVDVATSGWTSVVIDGARLVTHTKDMAPNCAVPVE